MCILTNSLNNFGCLFCYFENPFLRWRLACSFFNVAIVHLIYLPSRVQIKSSSILSPLRFCFEGDKFKLPFIGKIYQNKSLLRGTYFGGSFPHLVKGQLHDLLVSFFSSSSSSSKRQVQLYLWSHFKATLIILRYQLLAHSVLSTPSL